MPVREAPYSAKVTRAFIEDLVPEGYGVREALGREFGVSPRNPFALLEHIGADCAGAIQFFDPETESRPLIVLADDKNASSFRDALYRVGIDTVSYYTTTIEPLANFTPAACER